MSSEPRKTSLYDSHIAAGGKMVEFAGYSLPVQYSGVIAEYLSVEVRVSDFFFATEISMSNDV